MAETIKMQKARDDDSILPKTADVAVSDVEIWTGWGWSIVEGDETGSDIDSQPTKRTRKSKEESAAE